MLGSQPKPEAEVFVRRPLVLVHSGADLITPADAPKYPLFWQHYETFAAMVQAAVFTIRSGQAAL